MDTDNDDLVTIAKPGMREAEYFMYIGLVCCELLLYFTNLQKTTTVHEVKPSAQVGLFHKSLRYTCSGMLPIYVCICYNHRKMVRVLQDR